jgi:hypothetical protein
MDTVTVTGFAAVAAAILVFCGSVWLLLMVVMGARLAYFVTASVALSFLLIMSLVWSFTQLGPVGVLPTWGSEAAGDAPAEVDFGPAGSYPDDPWVAADQADEADLEKASELESAASDALEGAIEDGTVTAFENASDATPVAESTRFLEQDEAEFGAVLFGPAEEPDVEPQPGDENTAIVVMEFDPGNPLGLARTILLGTFVLLALHLFGLSRAERAARRLSEEYA